MAIPVIKELKKRGHEVVSLALTTAGAVMERAGLAHKRPLDYLSIDEEQRYGHKLLERHHTNGKGISVEESLAYLGRSLRELAEDIGEKKAWDEYNKYGLNAFCPVRFMLSVLKRENADAVIATTSPRMEKAALQAAFKLGIPSLCMVPLFAKMELDWLKRPDNGDYMSVYSQKVAQRLIEAGRQASKIIITGNPAFDSLADMSDQELGFNVRKEKGIAFDEKIILWAEQPEFDDPDLPRRVRQELNRVCMKQLGWKLIVRLHPSSTDATRESIPEGALQSHAHEPLHDVIAAADVVVTFTSTVAMESLLCGKPVMILAISQYSHLVDYSAEDGALVLDNLEMAEDALKLLLSDSSVAAELTRNRKTLPPIGSATGRICDFIESDEFKAADFE